MKQSGLLLATHPPSLLPTYHCAHSSQNGLPAQVRLGPSLFRQNPPSLRPQMIWLPPPWLSPLHSPALAVLTTPGGPECALSCSPRALCPAFSVLESSDQPYFFLTLTHLWTSSEYFLTQKASLSLLSHCLINPSPVSLSQSPTYFSFLAHSRTCFRSSLSGFLSARQLLTLYLYFTYVFR